jgi:hypothetical protein
MPQLCAGRFSGHVMPVEVLFHLGRPPSAPPTPKARTDQFRVLGESYCPRGTATENGGRDFSLEGCAHRS